MAAITSTNDFVTHFHLMCGTTIGERRKNMFKLLNQATTNKVLVDFQQILPKTPLEENFKLDAMIYCNRTEDILTALTSQNPVLIHRTIKRASVLLVRSISDITGQQFVSVLAKISLNAKLKLLNKCSIYLSDTNKAEEFFNAIKNTYGIYLATKLLPACSPAFVIQFLQSTRFKFTSHQLLLITQKHPNSIQSLLEILQKYVDVAQDYRNVFKYLSRNNVPLFINLRKTYNLDSLQLGRRATNNFILRNKDDVINNSKTYLNVLQTKYIRKSLQTEEFNCFYTNLFPPLITQFESFLEQNLTIAPSVDVLLSAFRIKYNTRLLDETKLVTPKLLEMLPNDERTKILKPEHKPSSCSDDEWTCYLSISEAIPLLKKRISLTSDIKSRATLIGLLVETCRINKDKAALLDLCNYMINQHRNDHISVRLSFLRGIRKGFKLENLDVTHWVPINELIQIFELNGEEFYYIDDFILGYIESCIKNDQPLNKGLLTLLKRRSFWIDWNLFTTKPSFEKKCLETIPLVLSDYGDNDCKYMLTYNSSLINWNKRHPSDKLLLSLDLPEVLKNVYTKENWNSVRNRDVFVWYALKNKGMSGRAALLQMFIPSMNLQKLLWLIQCDLDFFTNNLDSCVNLVLKTVDRSNSLWSFCKLYSHLDLPRRISDICLHALNQEELPDIKIAIKKNALTALSYLLPLSELLALKYSLGPYLKNISPDLIILETIVKYCHEKRLPSVKRLIFSLMNNLNESDLLKLTTRLLETNNKRVRKVALHILFRTMEKQTIMEVLKSFINDPSNVTLNKFILSTVFKYFIKNPNDYVWNIIQLSVNALDVDDLEAYKLVMQPSKVPEEYLIRYLMFMWNSVEKLPLFYKEYGSQLLLAAQPNLLPPEFSENIIEKYFFSYNTGCTTFYLDLQAFVCKYVCYNPEHLEKCSSQMFTAMRSGKDLKLRSYASHFVKQLSYECLKQNKKDVLGRFSEQWCNHFKPHEMFQEYLFLQLAFIKIISTNIAEIAMRVASLSTRLIDMYGVELLHPLSHHLALFSNAHFIKSINDEEEEMNRCVFIESLVMSKDSVPLVILGISLFNNFQPTHIATKTKFEDLCRMFRARPEPEIVSFLSELSTEQNQDLTEIRNDDEMDDE